MSMLPAPHTLSDLVTRHDPQLVMQGICTQRTTAWALLSEVASAPSQDLAERLRTDAVGRELQQAVEWLDETWQPDALTALRRLGRGLTADVWEAWRADAGQDLTALAAECATVLESCREELAAWQEGRDDEAKQVRVAQLALVASDSPLRAHARAVADGGSALAVVGDLVLAYLRLETGR